MSRLVQRWNVQNGRLVKLATPPYSAAKTVTKPFGYSVFQTGGTPVAPAPYPTYTDYPVIPWEQLDTSYSQRNLNSWAELPDVSVILRRLTQRAYVSLPEGFRGKTVDFKSGGTPYSVYAPNCMGMWGKGPEKAIIRLEPYSSSVAANVPPQVDGNQNGDAGSNPYTLMRLGPMNSTISAAVHNYGWALFGTNQPNQAANPNKPGTTSHPHNYSGLLSYMGSGSTDVWLVIGGIQGDWQSPPGETFQYANYKGKTACFFDYGEVTGFNEGDIASGAAPTDYLGASGERVGGGVGNNGSYNATYRDSFFHDFYVSGGPIFSGAGGPASNLCNGGTVIRCKSWYNANHFSTSTPGKQFGALNNEGTSGPVPLVYDQVDVRFTNNQNTLQQYHAFCGAWKADADNPNIQYLKPVWQSPAFGNNPPDGSWIKGNNGAFVVSMPVTYSGQPNTQTTPPLVTSPWTGQPMTARIRNSGQGWPSNIDPKTEYVLYR